MSVLLEKIEDKNGDVVVSAQKAQKIKGWYELEKAYEDNQSINGKITSKCKGGVIVEHIETGSLMFCPGSQISDKPMKSIDHLIGVEQKFAIIKLDKVRGNACVSRRQIVSSHKKEDKAKIIEKFKVGEIIKDAVVKGYSSFGCFFEVNNEIDVLVHLQEISYSRVNHPDEIFNIGEKHDLKVISIDKEKKLIVTIRKNELAKDSADARPEVFSPGNALDAKVTELDLGQRKIKLSVKAAQIDEEKSLIAKFGEGATKSGATLKGIFEKARDIYEEGMNSVVTVRDFSLIYDALTQFEEAMISAKMEGMNDEDEEQSEGDGEGFLLRDKGNDLDLRLARLENMIE